MQHYGLQTSRLIRTQFGPYTLDGLEAGATREVELKSVIRRWLKKLREGKLDLRSLDQLNKEKKNEDDEDDDENKE